MSLFEEIIDSRNIPIDDALIEVYVAEIRSENIRQAISISSSIYPLQDFNLMHIKRIQSVALGDKFEKQSDDISKSTKTKILEFAIGPIDSISLDTIESSLKELFITVKTKKIAKYAPECREEFDEWGKYWPITYHPSEADRIRTFERNMKENVSKEINDICEYYMQVALDSDIQHVAKLLNNAASLGGAIIVNPINNRVVMTCGDAIESCFLNEKSATYQTVCNTADFDMNCLKHRFETHPLYQSAVIYCIEGVAALVRGEKIEKYEDAINTNKQYLCTGLTLFTTFEPDVYTSMALTHSRINKVYYKYASTNGGLGSVYNIHSMSSLNHHYRVFKYMTNDDVDK